MSAQTNENWVVEDGVQYCIKCVHWPCTCGQNKAVGYRALSKDEEIIRGDEWTDGTLNRYIECCCWFGDTPRHVNDANTVEFTRAFRRKI